MAYFIPICLNEGEQYAWLGKEPQKRTADLQARPKKQPSSLQKKKSEREPFSVWQILDGEVIRTAVRF